MKAIFIILLQIFSTQQITYGLPPEREMYIPDVQEVQVIAYARGAVDDTKDKTEYPADMFVFSLTIDDKKVEYPLAHNSRIGKAVVTLLDHYENDEIFKSKLVVKVQFTRLHPSKEVYPEVEVDIKADPNSETIVYSHETEEFKYEVYWKTTCSEKFESKNCAFPNTIDKMNTVARKNPYHGHWECRKQEPCVVSSKCAQDTNYCLNDGECFQSPADIDTKYCKCRPFYMGDKCEVLAPIPEDVLLFSDPDSLPQPQDSTSCDSCPDDQCQDLRGYKICKATTPLFDECTDQCMKICGEKYCRMENENKISYFVKKSET